MKRKSFFFFARQARSKLPLAAGSTSGACGVSGPGSGVRGAGEGGHFLTPSRLAAASLALGSFHPKRRRGAKRRPRRCRGAAAELPGRPRRGAGSPSAVKPCYRISPSRASQAFGFCPSMEVFGPAACFSFSLPAPWATRSRGEAKPAPGCAGSTADVVPWPPALCCDSGFCRG